MRKFQQLKIKILLNAELPSRIPRFDNEVGGSNYCQGIRYSYRTYFFTVRVKRFLLVTNSETLWPNTQCVLVKRGEELHKK